MIDRWRIEDNGGWQHCAEPSKDGPWCRYVQMLVAALETISEGRGPFSTDQLTFATNVIEDMRRIAREALARP